MVLALPPAPSELKSITPYLQRADEVASADPVISYWCAYYAAQQGIALKVKDSTARHYLFELLGLLERMKTDIGPNDAVHDEAASAAYVENFALRLFTSADDEDRSGNISRNTAKKFLAAANFLELLRIFDSEKAAIDLPSVEEKIKYAKWKAAEIAKAIREGRKAIPGPAATATPEPAPSITAAPELPDLYVAPPSTPPSGSSALSPDIGRSTPPTAQFSSFSLVEHLDAHLLPDGRQPPQSPGNWSTIATPGSPGFRLEEDTSESSSPLGKPRMAFVSDELEGKTEDEIDAELTPPSSAAKSVYFSASAVGGVEAPSAPTGSGSEEDPFVARVVVSPPSASPFEFESPSSYPLNLPSAPTLPPPPPGPMTSTHPGRSPPRPGPTAPTASSPALDATTATVTNMPVELNPQVIGRIQKHCRFAISALDYEDHEQARKELQAALRMLGG